VYLSSNLLSLPLELVQECRGCNEVQELGEIPPGPDPVRRESEELGKGDDDGQGFKGGLGTAPQLQNGCPLLGVDSFRSSPRLKSMDASGLLLTLVQTDLDEPRFVFRVQCFPGRSGDRDSRPFHLLLDRLQFPPLPLPRSG